MIKGIVHHWILVFIISGFISCSTLEERSIIQLKKEGIIGNAKIIDCNIGSKGSGVILDYTFIVAGKIHKGKQSYYEMKNSVCSELYYKQVSIIYIEEEPDVNMLMISENDFKKMEYPFPDSLKWMKPYSRD